MQPSRRRAKLEDNTSGWSRPLPNQTYGSACCSPKSAICRHTWSIWNMWKKWLGKYRLMATQVSRWRPFGSGSKIHASNSMRFPMDSNGTLKASYKISRFTWLTNLRLWCWSTMKTKCLCWPKQCFGWHKMSCQSCLRSLFVQANPQ